MHRNSHSFYSGFTFVELLVVVAFIAIVSAILIASAGNSRTTRVLEGASREMAAAVHDAQASALAGQANPGEKACWYMVVYRNATSYSVRYAEPNGAGVCDGIGVQIVGTYTLSNGVQFSAAFSSFGFDVPNGRLVLINGTIPPPEMMAGNEDISLVNNGTTYHVCAYPGGRIEEKGTGGC